jgi:hypothetical protein
MAACAKIGFPRTPEMPCAVGADYRAQAALCPMRANTAIVHATDERRYHSEISKLKSERLIASQAWFVCPQTTCTSKPADCKGDILADPSLIGSGQFVNVTQKDGLNFLSPQCIV